MRVIRNDAFIQQRTKFTQRGSLIGMGLLIASVFLTSKNILISWLLLLAGFITAMYAVRVGNRFVRPPRPDAVLDKLLKGLDNKYTIYHYFLPAEHILLTPSGLIAIRTQTQSGNIVARKGRWLQRSFAQRLRIFLGEVGLGNPTRELQREIGETSDALSGLLGGEDGDEGAVPVEGVVAFLSAKAHLDVQDAEYPVVAAEQLKATVRKLAEAHPPLPGQRRKALLSALRGEEPESAEEEE